MVVTSENFISEEARLNGTETVKESLSRLVHRVLDPFGRYQKFLFIALCFNSAIVGINSTIATFYVYTPKSFNCIEDEFEVPNFF